MQSLNKHLFYLKSNDTRLDSKAKKKKVYTRNILQDKGSKNIKLSFRNLGQAEAPLRNDSLN